MLADTEGGCGGGSGVGRSTRPLGMAARGTRYARLGGHLPRPRCRAGLSKKVESRWGLIRCLPDQAQGSFRMARQRGLGDLGLSWQERSRYLPSGGA